MEKQELKLNTPLKIEEIDFRIQSINKGGYATILAYKDARADMNRLDNVCGVEGWQDKYETINGHLFCSIGIWSESKKEWIWKQNVGTESNVEKTKGEASDAFKRAGFCCGIGRELYDYPVISIKLNAGTKENPKNGEWYLEGDKAKMGYGLKIKEWVWNSEFKDGKLIYLSAVDTSGKTRFVFKVGETKELEAPKAPQKQLLTEKGYGYLMSEGTWQEIVKALSNRIIKDTWKKELEKRFATIEPPKKGAKEAALEMKEKEIEDAKDH